jgi:hypothetical protein
MLAGFTYDSFFISIIYVLYFTSIVLLKCGMYFITGFMSQTYYLCARW